MAITDNTAKWRVKKITNFTDKEREIATQAQAEEGVDNTKVMTPLRVKNAIDVKQPMMEYTSLGQLGLSSEATLSEIATNLPARSILRIEGDTKSYPNIVPAGAGQVVATRHCTGRYVDFWYTLTNGASVYFAKVDNNGVVRTWDKLFKDNRIATQAQAVGGTDNTTIMTPLRVKQEVERLTNPFNTFSYYGLDQSTCTWEDVWNATKDDITLRNTITLYTSITNSPNLTVPDDVTVGYRAEINYVSTDIFIVYLYPNASNKVYYGKMVSGSVYKGWKQLATNGALSMPSSKFITITVSEGNNYYTAPADGWVMATGMSGGSGIVGVLVCDNTLGYYDRREKGTVKTTCPVRKGDEVRMVFTDLTSTSARFYYAQSEV